MEENFAKDYVGLEERHWWFCVRRRILLQELNRFLDASSPFQKVLNIGAAGGSTSRLLQKFGKVVSLDLNSHLCQVTRQTTGTQTVQASLPQLPFSEGHFDIVCAFDTLEHVKDDIKAAREILRVTKSGGTIIITVPAVPSAWAKHDLVNQHFRRYSKKTLLALFPFATCIRITFFNFLLFPLIYLFRKTERLMPMRKKNDFEVTGPLLNKVLALIFLWELPLLKNTIPFPIGTSLFLLLKKTS